MAHARLGPSNHRWPKCPGSIRVEAEYPDVSGEAAIDGTGSHLLLEMCLDNAVRAEAYDGQIIGVNHPDKLGGWLVSIDRIERVQMCLDYISRRYRELSEQFPSATITVESETKSDPGAIAGRDDWWGTVDVTITVMTGNKCNFIEIVDFKDGRGWVHVPGNTQLISYLTGKMSKYTYNDGIQGIKRIMDATMIDGARMTIVQPKTNPVVRYEDVNPQDMAHAHFELIQAAKATDDPNAPLVPGKHCKWCKHKKNCTAEAEQSMERISTMTEVVPVQGGSLFETIEQTFGDITQLDDSKLSELASAKAGVMSVFERAEEEITRRLETGGVIPGYKLAPGNSKQVWAVDEEEVEKALKGVRLKKADIYPAKLISPAQMQKHQGLTEAQRKRLTEKLITVKAGDMKLKQVAHEPTANTAENLFADVVDTQVQSVQQCDTATEVAQPTQEISFL